MFGRAILEWTVREDRTVAYLARQCGMEADRVVDLVIGYAAPTRDDLLALAEVTAIPVANLQRAADAAPATPTQVTEPSAYVSAKEAAVILGVGRDTVYSMMKNGALPYALVGAKLKKIRRRVLDDLPKEQSRPQPAPSEPPPRGVVSDEPPPGRLL